MTLKNFWQGAVAAAALAVAFSPAQAMARRGADDTHPEVPGRGGGSEPDTLPEIPGVA